MIKSKKGFTLVELLIVVGIIAVLAAIAIPTVAGIINRSNKSADATNATEMTNAIERFVSEYQMARQDIFSGKFKEGSDADSAQGRVFSAVGISTKNDIKALEKDQYTTSVLALSRETKYPLNEKTVKKVLMNYMKTSYVVFAPKQSDMSFYYSPELGIVIVAETGSTKSELLNIALAQTNVNVETTEWINLTLNANKTENDWANEVWATDSKDQYISMNEVTATNPNPDVDYGDIPEIGGGNIGGGHVGGGGGGSANPGGGGSGSNTIPLGATYISGGMNKCQCGIILNEPSTDSNKKTCPQCGDEIANENYWNKGVEYGAGDALPTVQDGDVYINGDYTYMYNCTYSAGGYWTHNPDINGWSVVVNDKTKTNYSGIVSSINNRNITSLYYTFAGCSNMTTAPSIPSSCVNLVGTFYNCSKLSNVSNVIIGENVKNISNMFKGCSKLTNDPTNPILVLANITNNDAVKNAFDGTGQIYVSNRTSTVKTVSETLVRIVHNNNSVGAVCKPGEFAEDDGYIMDFYAADSYCYEVLDGYLTYDEVLDILSPSMTVTIPSGCAGNYAFRSYDSSQDELYECWCGKEVPSGFSQGCSFDAAGLLITNKNKASYDDDDGAYYNNRYYCDDCGDEYPTLGSYYAFYMTQTLSENETAYTFIGEYSGDDWGYNNAYVIFEKN